MLIGVIFYLQSMGENIFIGGETIRSSKKENLFGVIITEHVHKIYDKANQKVNTLVPLSSFMILEK